MASPAKAFSQRKALQCPARRSSTPAPPAGQCEVLRSRASAPCWPLPSPAEHVYSYRDGGRRQRPKPSAR
eukprot:6709111-Pyramimonas_sp.AAC.1